MTKLNVKTKAELLEMETPKFIKTFTLETGRAPTKREISTFEANRARRIPTPPPPTGQVPSPPGGTIAFPEEEAAPERTIEERARSLIQQERGEQREVETELFGKAETPSLLEDEVQQFVSEQKRQQEFAQRQSLAAAQAESLQFQTQEERAEAAIAGARTSLAQGREGPISAAAPLAVQVFAKNVNRQIESARIQVGAAQERRNEAQRRLALAQSEGRIAAARNFQSQLDNAELEIQRVQTELLRAQGEAAQIALDVDAAKIDAQDAAVDRVSNILDSLGTEGVIAMTGEGMAAIFTSNGLEASFGLAIHAAQTKLAEAQKKEDQVAIDQAKAELANEKAKLATVGKTAAVQNFQFLQGLTDPVQRKEFREMLLTDPRLQFVKVGDDAYSFNPETGATQKVVDSSQTNNLIPTGIRVKGVVNGIDYELDQAAMVAFTQANEASIAAGVGPIQTQSSDTASFRTDAQQMGIFGQGRTVEQLLSRGFTPEEASQYAQPELEQVSWTNESVHELGLALDIKADRDYINSVKPFLNGKGWKQTATSMGDFGHFEFQGTTGVSTAQARAAAIFSGTSLLTLKDLPTKERADVDVELNKLKQQALAEGNVIGALRASAGGSTLSAGERGQIIKTATVVDQVGSLISALSNPKKIKGKNDEGKKIDLKPLTGFFRAKNPWDKSAQELNAILQGTIPNLARGVFGEVGVLTDRDIELYRRTLPTLSQTSDVQKSVTALTLRTLRNSLTNQLTVQAGAGVDVSGLVPFFSKIDNSVKQLESELGITNQENLEEDIGFFEGEFLEEDINEFESF